MKVLFKLQIENDVILRIIEDYGYHLEWSVNYFAKQILKKQDLDYYSYCDLILEAYRNSKNYNYFVELELR